MSACDFLPLQLSVTIQELVLRVPPTIFVWFHPYVYFRSLVLGRLSLSASKYGRENLDRIFAGIENQTLNFMGKVPESAGFGKCRVLSHPASQPRIRGSFLFFFPPLPPRALCARCSPSVICTCYRGRRCLQVQRARCVRTTGSGGNGYLRL